MPKQVNYRAATIDALCSMSEAELQARIIEPLMRLMGFGNVRNESGPSEKGKDLIASKMDLGSYKLYAIQIKKVKPTGKIASKNSMVALLNQLQQMMKEEVRDPINNEYRPPDRGVFITPYEIPKNSIESAIRQVRQLERREITIVDGTVLVDLVLKYMPEAVAEIDDELSYRIRLARDADIVLESSAFGLREDLSLDSIYVDLSVMFGGMSSLQALNKTPRRSMSKIVRISESELIALGKMSLEFAGKELAFQHVSRSGKAPQGGHMASTEPKRGQLERVEIDIWPLFKSIRERLSGFVKSFNKAKDALPVVRGTDGVNVLVEDGLELSEDISRLLGLGVIRRHWPKLIDGSSSDDPKLSKKLTLPASNLAYFKHPVLLTGRPGSGKTTLLRRLTQEISRTTGTVIPIFVPLIRLGQASEEGLIRACMSSLERLGYPAEKKALLKDLESGRVRLMLDGLDETGSMAPKVFSAIRTFSKRYHKSPVFVTCREAFIIDKWPEAFHLNLNSFTDKQLSQFIRNWFRAEPSEQAALEKWFGYNQAMREAARVPVVAALLCSLKHADADMPSTQVDLYEGRLELLLGRWERAKGMAVLSPRLRKLYVHFLMALAVEMHMAETNTAKYEMASQIGQSHYQVGGYSIRGETLVLDCMQRGILLYDRAGNLNFGHLTYQEFLVGRYLASQNPVKLIWEKMTSPWWRGSLEFYASTIGDISQLLTEILGNAGASKRASMGLRLATMAPLTSADLVAELGKRK